VAFGRHAQALFADRGARSALESGSMTKDMAKLYMAKIRGIVRTITKKTLMQTKVMVLCKIFLIEVSSSGHVTTTIICPYR
jgi:hypothetical protein